MLNIDFFHTELPGRPMGKYAHIVTLRVTEGYAVFQTDGELNRARVAAGVADQNPMTRITLFKRKQTTPERLNGRETLRNFGFLADILDVFPDGKIPDKDKEISTKSKEYNKKRGQTPYACFYNVHSCKRCPDCIAYGFAIGDSGSEKSKIYSDTAFSLTDYASSHEIFTLNAPYESGTMSDRGDVATRISQQDHVKPQVVFPSVLTTRDLTASLFFYVLQNVLRTSRYGATTTRGGTVKNHIAAIVLSDGEIFSNLLLTQRLHDELQRQNKLPNNGNDPVNVQDALNTAQQIIPTLLAEDNVHDTQVLIGNDLDLFLNDVRLMNHDAIQAQYEQAMADCETYHKTFIKSDDKK